MSFKNLKNVTPVTKDSTAKYEFHAFAEEIEIDGVKQFVTPWIEVRPTGELNKPYMNAVLTTQSKNRRKLSKGRMSVSMLEENRAEDRNLYPRFVFTGNWGGWISSETDEEIPYSEAKACELLERLEIDDFDELRGFCSEMSNFRS